jgi:hypothetical protein
LENGPNNRSLEHSPEEEAVHHMAHFLLSAVELIRRDEPDYGTDARGMTHP